MYNTVRRKFMFHVLWPGVASSDSMAIIVIK